MATNLNSIDIIYSQPMSSSPRSPLSTGQMAAAGTVSLSTSSLSSAQSSANYYLVSSPIGLAERDFMVLS